MPKELTHWHVAGRALAQIPDNLAGRLIQAYPALYYLGATAHDTAFYDLSRPAEASLERVGNLLHGVNGENTLVPLIDMLTKALLQEQPEPLLSFVLGMLTHYLADSTFHPFVYYFSGNYFDEDPEKRAKAVFRHRLLETALDAWFGTVDPMEYPHNLALLWRECGADGRRALTLLIDRYAYAGDRDTVAHFKQAWRNHRLLQAAFRWSVPWRLLDVYRRFGHPGVEKIEALFYPQPLDLSIFQDSLVWRHPVSGEEQAATIHEIFLASVTKVVELFSWLGSQACASWPGLLRELPPLSLDTGLAYVPVAEMRYFYGEPIESKLRAKSN